MMAAKKKTITRIVTLLLAFVFLTLGVKNGEVAIVLNKAIHICMECIGLG